MKFAFIPKLTGVGFFTSGGEGAKEMGDKLGVQVKYDGPSEASVSGQVKYINNFINQNYDALMVSSTSVDGLSQSLQRAKKRDDGVNMGFRCESERSFLYISQGTPDQLANLLIEMTSKQIGDKGK